MDNIIDPNLLFAHFTDGDWFRDALRPFLRSHAHGSKAEDSSLPWRWDVQSARKCLDAAWGMLGKWQARRAVMVSRCLFDATVPEAIAQLADVLNRQRVSCLRDLSDASDEKIESVTEAVIGAVGTISGVKPTKVLAPMFGSKVVHHYFPSVVPAFDHAKVRDVAMQSTPFYEFKEGDAPWSARARGSRSHGRELDEFDWWFTFCAAQIAGAPIENLTAARMKIGHRCSGDDRAMRGDPDSLLWKLDAKIAEFCAVGAAARELRDDSETG